MQREKKHRLPPDTKQTKKRDEKNYENILSIIET